MLQQAIVPAAQPTLTSSKRQLQRNAELRPRTKARAVNGKASEVVAGGSDGETRLEGGATLLTCPRFSYCRHPLRLQIQVVDSCEKRVNRSSSFVVRGRSVLDDCLTVSQSVRNTMPKSTSPGGSAALALRRNQAGLSHTQRSFCEITVGLLLGVSPVSQEEIGTSRPSRRPPSSPFQQKCDAARPYSSLLAQFRPLSPL
jgi:hypothetical protein